MTIFVDRNGNNMVKLDYKESRYMTNEELLHKINMYLIKNVYDEISFSSLMKLSDFMSNLMREIKGGDKKWNQEQKE